MEFQIKEHYEIQDLLKIVEMLRDKDHGCPWDKVQTHQSIRKNFIEETYEAVEAIDLDDKALMQEELGDVLLQILLHAQFEAENKVFDFSDVVDGIAQKLVLRHPHIFKGYDNKTVEGVLQKWEEIKKQEKGQQTVSQTLDAIPKTFPSLMYAQKLQKRAVAGQLMEASPKQIVQSLNQNINTINNLLEEGHNIKETLGEMLFNMVFLAESTKSDAEEVLAFENAKKLAFLKELDQK